jgi:hypothetical protein
MKKIYWISKDYNNESLNNLARRVTEYNTADLLSSGYEVYFGNPPGSEESRHTGIILTDPFITVEDIYIVNDIFNHNVYFEQNNENRLQIPKDLYGTFDCLISLAAGEMIKNNPIDIGLDGNHYVVDISPTALHKSVGIYKNTQTEFTQLDIFNINAVKEFIKNCKGTKGFFSVSNCFMYIVNSLLYDVNIRLRIQNEFVDVLANDKIDWYVSMRSADGINYRCVRAKDIQNKKLDERFNVLPWIQIN